MTRTEVNNEYFEWLCALVRKAPYSRRFRTLLHFLHDVEFTYILPMDGNRAEHGIELRYRFGYEKSYSSPMIATYLDDRPCSILEMMVALATTCEKRIMHDPEFGDRSGLWFWDMIKNLGLRRMDDEHFDEEYVSEVITRFLDRQYERNGAGGLFTVNNTDCDLRTVDIWYQMCWYLDGIV